MEKTLLFAESQFRDLVPGECYRQLKNGVTYKTDWDLFALRDLLTDSYFRQNTAATFEIALGYATETRAQLEMRRSNNDYRETFFSCIYRVNTLLSCIFCGTIRYEQALYHWQEALAAARLCEYDDKSGKHPENLITALLNTARGYTKLRNGGGATYAEEAYSIVSALYGPEHPEVQRVATYLIDCYEVMGNFVDAGRFARINYECLSDPNSNTDRKGQVFASAKGQLAEKWARTPAAQRDQGPEVAEKAEILMREACDILENIEMGKDVDDPVASTLSMTYNSLASEMIARDKKDSEVEKTILRALSFTKKCRVGAVPRTRLSLDRYSILKQLGRFYFTSFALDNVFRLQKAKFAYEESVIIATALFSSDDQRLLDCTSQLSMVNTMMSFRAEDVNRISERIEGEKVE